MKILSWRLPAIAIASSIVLLAAVGTLVDWHKVFVNGMEYTLNDQVGYISVARNLACCGKLESTIIWPFTLAEPGVKSYLYMPGHYLALAAAFKIFGYSAAHSFLPALAGFLLSSVLVVVIACKLFGPQRALGSWMLFALFPLNLIYAFTAMSEISVTTSVLTALAVFLWIPARWRAWLGPVTLVLPLYFRETGIVVAALMAAIVYKDSGRRFKPVAVFCLLAILVAALVLASPVAKGRPSLLSSNLIGRTTDIAVSDWTAAIGRTFAANSAALFRPYSQPGADLLQAYGLYFILTGIPLALWQWIRKRDEIYPAICLMLVAVLGGLLGLYTVWWFRGARHLLLMEPFVAMLWADFAVDVGQRLPARRVLAWSAVAAFLAIGVIGVNSVFKTEAYINKYSDRDIAFIEAMGHDSGGILVSPWEFSLDYCLKHFPVRYSLIPGSDSGLRFLNQKHPISTLALRKGMEDQVLTAGTIASIGLVKEKEMELGGQPFVIFKRPPAVPPSAAR